MTLGKFAIALALAYAVVLSGVGYINYPYLGNSPKSVVTHLAWCNSWGTNILEGVTEIRFKDGEYKFKTSDGTGIRTNDTCTFSEEGPVI